MKFSLSIRFALFSLLLLPFSNSCNRRAEYLTVEGFTQGTTYHISYSPDVDFQADSLVEALLFRIDTSLSVYNPNSLISKVNRNETELPDQPFLRVFTRAKEIWQATGGAFDVSGAPLFDAWGFGFKKRDSVTPPMIDSILNFVGMDKISISGGRVVKSDNRVSVNFNAIAQGFTSDFIAEEFDRTGIKNYMIEVGGEIFCRGLNPKGKFWRVGIDRPTEGNITPGEDLQDILEISGKGLATSGNYRKYYESDGLKYSHTIDPRSGYPVRHSLLSATVIAADAMTADALATFFMVVGLEGAKEFLKLNSGIDAYLVYSEKDGLRVFKTPGVKGGRSHSFQKR
ncbi:MAG: FAD:protein FMN transferase [Bacteroidales bacterium]|nr:FAD:protein FMN transferase [Bacteroidales bacterium]MDD2425369.1 FAD:protein FMN transferase [Bacteroidales bacterium]MDD3988786.1 FAD:protein FMN transferase [Bacteroidales bacterium]MDD4638891.1 FAD:protein FMN transferase [Bacteroidales bacterium]